MSFLMGIGAKAWGYIVAAVTVVIGVLTMLAKVKQAGRDEIAAKVNVETGAANARMAEAAVQSPKGKNDVAEAARRHQF